MKKLAFLIILLFCAGTFAQDLPKAAAGQNKDTVAVYMAGAEPMGALGSHKIMGGELEKAISRSQNYIAVNRTDDILNVLAKEHGYTRSGTVNDAQIKKIGNQLGVQYLCIVEISAANRGYYVAARLVDVVSARIVNTSSAGSRLENYNEQMAVAQRIARELTGVDLGTGRQTQKIQPVQETKPTPAPEPTTSKPPPTVAAAQPDSAKTATASPRGLEAQVPESTLPPSKPFRAQASLSLLVPINFGGESNFKPWWNMGYHANYRDLDVDAQFSRGWGLDFSLYTFSKKEYDKYYESKDKEDNIEDRSISNISSMLIVDLAYHLKFYPINQYKIPYISGSAGFCGAYFGNGKVSYNEIYNKKADTLYVSKDEDLIKDNYILNAAVGVGVDVPLHKKLRLFAEIHYSLRVGLSLMFGEDGEFWGGIGAADAN